ncbi:hypothetical protein PDESU_04648 [Pontiella desulfatans]|uniref:Tyrosine specific protein phosphatases domain-containing protein n=1 Tax=Pontiella desulfatans TaxID=2750659 RepID=A0A6C2U7J1_PONDE|nr:protein-tyrosine phosphatase family protein [Pontiella desulfatans]VGO16058.1 hypothetical protein PDESU_04648 [Pontiella desulfatans]
MIPFRKVELETSGSLYLHSMPGKEEPLAECFQALEETSVDRIICLNRQDELDEKSPDYAKAIADGTLPCEHIHFPIGNFGVPEDREAFLTLAKEFAEQLKAGKNILVHCAGGVGRTGTLASCITTALNKPLSLVTAAGGKAETDQQRELIASL